MLRSTSNTRPKWALALRRESQMAIGQQLGVECELPEELPPELTTPLIRGDREHNPYADIVGKRTFGGRFATKKKREGLGLIKPLLFNQALCFEIAINLKRAWSVEVCETFRRWRGGEVGQPLNFCMRSGRYPIWRFTRL
jgi:hypothetical protein